jgi:hypothetical protein
MLSTHSLLPLSLPLLRPLSLPIPAPVFRLRGAA